MVPSKTTAKPAFDCHVPFFPSNFFNQSPSIRQLPPAMLPPTQPASNVLVPSNAVFPHVNLPAASDFIPVDSTNNSFTTNPELPTLPTPIDCCVFIPTQPASNDTTPSNVARVPDSPDIKLSVNTLHEYITEGFNSWHWTRITYLQVLRMP
jgi:hypothetical protein